MTTAADRWIESEDVQSYIYAYPRIPGLSVMRISTGGIEFMTIVRGVQYNSNPAEEKTLAMDSLGQTLISMGALPYEEMTRRGAGWQAMNTSALAALVVRPSTTANFTLFNNNPSGSDICFVVHRAFAFNLVSVTAEEAKHAVWLCVHPPGLVSPTNDITARASTVGKVTANTANAICDTAMAVTDDGWFPWGTEGHGEPGILPGSVSIAHVDGAIIVPPQCGVSTQVVSSSVGNTFTTGFHWFVKRLVID